ncbi:hypothetical protein TrRE_jg11027 [Triparma retinervis]|uniref:Phosphatidate phosphatase APP1 catalytic domain-containing protein n=1 Tax=Triparma retinervis TaxID=2557542 RepID=A0A9W7F8J7_9STRA|nr:hypothetical protein TrRE_jg11027 [Triparma retinervis]
MNLVLSHYLSALKKRPYVSGRVSSVYGDPLNDAEVLRIRFISFGLTYRSIIIWVEGRSHKWVVHTFCALWLLLLVYSSSKMFGMSFREVRERLSSQRSRGNSAYSENGERAGELFDEMITEDNVVAKMGSRRKIKDMFTHSSLEEEKVRWSLAAGEEKLTWLGYVLVGIKVITDVDDTLKSSGGVKAAGVALGGIDVQYPRGAMYPGVFQFMFELTVHSSSSPMNLAVLTARAEEFKAALELKPTSPICVKAKRAGEKAGVRGWGVGPVLYGSVAEWVNQANKGRRKFSNFETLMSANLPATTYVYVGDTGEMDGEAGEQMLRYYPGLVKGVFLHVVSEDIDQGSVEVPRDKILRGRPLVHFRTYVGAARKAWEWGMMGEEGVERVKKQAEEDLREMGIGKNDVRWEDVEKDWEVWEEVRP